MEGYKDIFWDGDEIVWKNFIKNYIRSLDHVFSLTILLGNDKLLDINDIKTLSHRSNYRTTEHHQIIEGIFQRAFSQSFITGLPKSLASRINPIRRSELLYYLQILHQPLLNSISDTYFHGKFMNKRFFYQDLVQFTETYLEAGTLVDLANQMEIENENSKATVEQFFSMSNLYSQQLRLLSQYGQESKIVNSNAQFLYSEFPEKYLTQLERSIHPEWYSASFLSECSNSSIWGHYGDNHKGVCLKFKVNESASGYEMNLETKYGHNGAAPLIGMRPHKFKKIEYSNKHTEIDFFRSIALLTIGEINAMWYSDGKGGFSTCGDHLNNKDNEWQQRYWDNFNKILTIKLEEWSYEKEYRLIIKGDLTDYTQKGNRKLKYDFTDLESIIFGIKTKTEDKLKIIRIIEEKCIKHNCKKFDFYQAYYSTQSGKIENFRLNLLNVE